MLFHAIFSVHCHDCQQESRVMKKYCSSYLADENSYTIWGLGHGCITKATFMWGIKAVLLRASGNKYTKNWSIFVWKDLLWLWAPGGITAWHGRTWGTGCRAQKCLQSCDAFPQGLKSIAKCIAEEITPQQKCADCRKEASEPTEAGEAAFPLLFCCRSSYGE